MSVSQLARAIAESPTVRLNEKARLLREDGLPVIHLGAGEPKSKIPIDAVIAASSTIVSADVRYTPSDGIRPLKKAIVRYTEENYDLTVAPENVLVSSGAKQVLDVILTTILNQQDEVIILAPYWVSYPEMVKMKYGIPIVVTPEDGRYHPRIEDIEQKLSSYTKAIIVNSPNNPSGLVYSKEFIRQVVELAEKKGIYVIMDDIYHKLIFDGHEFHSAYKYMKKDLDESRIIVVNGVSKAYAMTGFRIGWVVAARKLIEVMINVQAQTTTCASMVSQAAAVGALNGVQSGVEALRVFLQNNKDVMMQELRAFDGVKITEPGGTFYCFPDFSAYSNDSNALSRFLLEKAMVVTVPGVEFGMEGHLRLSYCGTVKSIKEGVARIKWALDPNSPNEIYIGDRRMVRDWK